MISDPKTTPDSRAGRIVFAALVALGAAYVQFKLFRTNGLLWSLAGCSFLRPAHRPPAARRAAIDWTAPTTGHSLKEAPPMKRIVFAATLVGLLVLADRARSGLLRFLRVQGGHEALQPRVASRADPRRQSHGADDGQRLQRRSEGVRHRHPGADPHRARADSHRRQSADRSSRRLLRAAAGRILRRQPVRTDRVPDGAGGAAG